MDIVLYVPREPIDIIIPGPSGCEINDCNRPDTHIIFWLNKDWTQLRNNLICARHAFILRGISGGAVFPQKFSPPLQWVLAKVNEEIARRRPPVQNFTFSTTTSTGSIYYNFGGMQ